MSRRHAILAVKGRFVTPRLFDCGRAGYIEQIM